MSFEKTRVEVCERHTIDLDARDGYGGPYMHLLVSPNLPSRYQSDALDYSFRRQVNVQEIVYQKIELRFVKWVSISETATADHGYYVITRSWVWVPADEALDFIK